MNSDVEPNLFTGESVFVKPCDGCHGWSSKGLAVFGVRDSGRCVSLCGFL